MVFCYTVHDICWKKVDHKVWVIQGISYYDDIPDDTGCVWEGI